MRLVLASWFEACDISLVMVFSFCRSTAGFWAMVLVSSLAFTGIMLWRRSGSMIHVRMFSASRAAANADLAIGHDRFITTVMLEQLFGVLNDDHGLEAIARHEGERLFKY